MKVAVAQINPTIGDLQGNTQKIIGMIKEAGHNGANLIVFPELALTGYPPRDLLLYEDYIKRVKRIVHEEIMPVTGGLSVLLGVPWKEPGDYRLFNSALLLKDGELSSLHNKTLLPNYDVFDESRYFTPATGLTLAELNGKKVAVTICEDIWNDKDFFERRNYSQDPVEELFQNGAEMLINLSASPYHIGKARLRANMLCALARKYQSEVIYVNQVGGNDELIFDGSSMFCSADGELLYRAQQFKEELFYVNAGSNEPSTGVKKQDDPLIVEEDMDWVFSALSLGLSDYMAKSGFHKVVLGLSGGIDSAVVAALAADALGPENVCGVMMPSRYSSEHSVKDSEELAQNLGIETRFIPIKEPFDLFINLLNNKENTSVDLAEENLQARIRASILMFISNREGWMVLPTGNKSELAVGYCTLYGDMSGGLGILADLPKMSVYRLAEYINRKAEKPVIPRSIIEKAPSAELRPDQKDQDSLPPYEILDRILQHYIEENKHIDEIVAMGFEEKTVKDVIKKTDRSEYKRFQAAPGLRITTRAFGSGRRMPLARGRM